MTENSWQPIAIIITAIIAAVSQLVAPSLAVLVKASIDRPKPTPKASQPRLETTIKFRETRPWLLWGVRFIVNFFCVTTLYNSLRYPFVPTSRHVVLISLAMIVFVLLFIWPLLRK
ncbi:MAG: hypothetical protein QOI77_287 [Blastocatellia bacterium]|jgi:hypothetical protein|nr:hypothetical protein [Blastocatellia bacterium]